MSGTWSRLMRALSFNNSKPSNQVPPAGIPNSSSQADSLSNASSSSFTSRFSRSLSSTVRSSKKTCAICLGNVRSGQGQAIFTAECSHSFHFSCIVNSVKHGNYVCPICRAIWNEIPFKLSSSGGGGVPIQGHVSPYQSQADDFTASYSRPLRSLVTFPPEPTSYSDDEPLLASSDQISSPPTSQYNVSIQAFTEFPAFAASDSVSEFAVLVGVRAPPQLDNGYQVERTPVDLVTVLDVSSSMTGPKLLLLKRAVCFVIDNLGPSDRLSIVTFASSARRIFPLRRMSDTGREDAKAAVNSLCADGETDILQGLKKGARVLEERSQKNPVASIILLSDGKDTYNTPPYRQYHASANRTRVLEYLNILPDSIRRNNREERNDDSRSIFPVHTFGFGRDHDSYAMHAISDESGGTFSFIETIETVQDAFARCIGGILSVVAQNLCLRLSSASHGVKIGSIPSGKYQSEVTNNGLQGTINVGDLYADEEKQFLVYLSFPAFEDEHGVENRTPLLNIACSYHDTASKCITQLDMERVEINRPTTLSPTDTIPSLEVDRQRNRLMVAKAIKEAQEMAETGNVTGAQTILTNCRSVLISSASARAGDGLCNWLESELLEVRDRMVNMQMYEHTGRAYVLSGLSSHSWQRATTRGDSTTHSTVLTGGDGSYGNAGPFGYDTPSMVSMVSKSQTLNVVYNREQDRRENKSASLSTNICE